MSQPEVNITELDGALGILPPSSGKLLVVAGVASTGPVDTPSTYARGPALSTAFGIGPAVEAARYFLERFGRPVVFIRTGQSTAGSCGAVTQTGTGTSVVTVDAVADEPDDDFEFYIEIVTGGTIGVAGITLKYSLDGGRTLSPEIALGTANSYVIPGSGGVEIDFAAGTLVAGDTIAFRGNAPAPSAAEVGTALDALKLSAVSWELVHIAAPVDGTIFDTIETKVTGMASSGKHRAWIGNTRMPNAGESEAAYKTALDAIFGAKSTKHGMLCAGACKLTSSVSGRQYRRPVSFAVAALEGSVSQEINTADINLGPLVGVAIRDSDGNVDDHDESANPGLDDSRFCVLRTWDEVQGVYVNRPRLLSPAGSDFELLPHRRVMNLALETLRAYFVRRLSKPILVDKTTGFILESEAAEIESGGNAVLRAVLLTKPKASDAYCVIDRNVNILSTKTLSGQARVVPLAYPETVELEVGFSNPALQVQTA